jgi:hypothetical protein
LKIPPALKLALPVIAIGVAGYFLVRFFLGQGQPEEEAYFYDLSEQKLFAASRKAVPPIRGINNAEEDGVRAVVVSTSGDPHDRRRQRIAYLEKYGRELKAQIEARQKGGTGVVGNQIDRVEAQSYTFVRRVDETKWHAVNTPEAEKIMGEWMTPGPGGETPVICVP